MSTTLQPSPHFYVYSVVVWSEGVSLGFAGPRGERIKASTPMTPVKFGCDFEMAFVDVVRKAAPRGRGESSIGFDFSSIDMKPPTTDVLLASIQCLPPLRSTDA